MNKQTVGTLVAVGVVFTAKLVLAETGTEFDGADDFFANSGMKLVYWLLLAAFLGVVGMAMGIHFSPGVIAGLVVMLFVGGVVASHETVAGFVGVTAAAELTEQDRVGLVTLDTMPAVMP